MVLKEMLLAGSDDCSDTALGRKWFSRALHSHAASLSAPSKRDAHSRSQGVLHHQLQLLVLHLTLLFAYAMATTVIAGKANI